MHEKKQLDVCAEIGTVETYLRDLCFLSQHILEDFFEHYEQRNNDSALEIMYETPRYASLFRILDLQIYEIHARVIALEDFMLKKNDRRESSSNGQ